MEAGGPAGPSIEAHLSSPCMGEEVFSPGGRSERLVGIPSKHPTWAGRKLFMPGGKDVPSLGKGGMMW